MLNNGFLEPLGVAAEDTLVNTFYYDRPPAESQTNVAYRVPDLGVFYAGRVEADTDDPNRATLSGVLVIQNDGTTVTAPSGVWNSEKGEQTWTLEDVQVEVPGSEPRLEPKLTLPFSSDAAASEDFDEQRPAHPVRTRASFGRGALFGRRHARPHFYAAPPLGGRLRRGHFRAHRGGAGADLAWPLGRFRLDDCAHRRVLRVVDVVPVTFSNSACCRLSPPPG